MYKKNLKKLTILILLVASVTVFILSAPHSNAQMAFPFTMTASPAEISEGQTSKITVMTDTVPNQTVVFLAAEPGSSLPVSPFNNSASNTCTPAGAPRGDIRDPFYCSIDFKASEPKTYTISARIQKNSGVFYDAKPIKIKVTSNSTTARLTASCFLCNSIIDFTETPEIKVQTIPVKSGVTVTFSFPNPTNLPPIKTDPGTCQTRIDGSCIVKVNGLGASDSGTYEINYSAPNWVNSALPTVSGKISMQFGKVLSPVVEPPKSSCEDGKDNDGDGLIDTADPNCHTDQKADNTSSYDIKGNEGSNYAFLAPLKCDPGLPGCVKGEDGEYYLKTFDPSTKNALSTYLNIMIKILIGIAAVLAVIMIVMGGIQYMTSELISSKEEGKHRIQNAITGLLVALGAYLLLFTINPRLLIIEPDTGVFTSVTLPIENFEIPSSSTYNGRPIKVSFKSEAYPAANFASKKTGVETAFILAMFAQETSSGGNTGKCNYLTANMGPGQLEALKKLFPNNYSTINMSCSGGGSTHGGAIGYTQFLPGTWLQYSSEASRILGHEPNPWNTGDALMMTALFLKDKGGAGTNATAQENAACKYFGSCNRIVTCAKGVTGTYGQCVMAKKLSIQQQIDSGIANGSLAP